MESKSEAANNYVKENEKLGQKLVSKATLHFLRATFQENKQ